MTQVAPRFHQLGYVVRDVDRAMRDWTTRLGVGPFFIARDMPMLDFRYRGQPSAPVISLATTHWGDQQIEIIQQHNDAPSGYLEFLDAGYEGLQHLGIFSDDVKADLARAHAAGYTMLQEGLSPMDHVTRFYYLTAESHPGGVIEFLEMTPRKYDVFRNVAATCASWDGSDPVRTMPFKGQKT